MNKIYNDLIREGYSTTGVIEREWDKEIAVARSEEYKVMGNKVRVALKVEQSPRRGQAGYDRSAFWCVLVKYSDEYKTFLYNKRVEERKARRARQLQRALDNFTMEDLTAMLNAKCALMAMKLDFPVQSIVVATETTNQVRKDQQYMIMNFEATDKGPLYTLRPVDSQEDVFTVRVLNPANCVQLV